MTRRAVCGLLFAMPLVGKLAGRWRSRITVFKSGRATAARIRLLFSGDDMVIEEYRPGGELGWLYKGTVEISKSDELTFRVSSVSNAAGAEATDGRYRAGESYSLGILESISATRARLGAWELLKELE
ncbi:MAG: hypothetical protein FJW38_09230 [Acidobacteria bacterium]|nr:hypothetical protein [Acidobacteriota bacterium]